MIVGKSSNVVKLKWSSVSLNDARQDGSNRLKLASVSDDSNTIYIWNVREGRLYQELVEVTSDKNVRVLGILEPNLNLLNLYILIELFL